MANPGIVLQLEDYALMKQEEWKGHLLDPFRGSDVAIWCHQPDSKSILQPAESRQEAFKH